MKRRLEIDENQARLLLASVSRMRRELERRIAKLEKDGGRADRLRAQKHREDLAGLQELAHMLAKARQRRTSRHPI